MRAYYSAEISDFIESDKTAIVGQLNIGGTEFVQQYTRSTTSWENSIEILRSTCLKLIESNSICEKWHILLEYELPRLPFRLDFVIIANDMLFVIEFKDEREIYPSGDIEQSLKYSFGLRNFHYESRDKVIVPILLAPNAPEVSNIFEENSKLAYKNCLKANTSNLAAIILQSFTKYHIESMPGLDPYQWMNSDYQPTLNIIEAAISLFSNQKVEAITRSGSDEGDLRKTTNYLKDIINEARTENKKVICFVTGVPGAGKTLVGLNLVHESKQFGDHESNTAYFSGNTPLVNVLREALSKENFGKEMLRYKLDKANLNRPKKISSDIIYLSKIQNLHLFVKEFILGKTKPHERIVVFDEAQRCWDAKHFTNKSKQNQNREKEQFLSPNKSEAEMIIEFMNGHEGWAVIVALVGPGQEINTGEAGISEWGNAILSKFQNWEVHTCSELTVSNSMLVSKPLFNAGQDLDSLKIVKDDRLFLKVNQRSFKAKDLISWVDFLLDNKPEKAKELSKTLKAHFPLLLTRKLSTVRNLLKERSSPGHRIGLIASSQGIRLRPYGIIVRDTDFNEVSWFLNDADDVRSSNFLEIVATEYKVQGLELDWVGICWDADLRRSKPTPTHKTDWDYKTFSGNSWSKKAKVSEELRFIKNTYRVLLTRAREGFVIFVPEGDECDNSRLPEFYNPIFEYLKSCGMDVELDSISGSN